MITKLTWKHKWLDDKSGSWYSAKVPVLGWEYIVEECYGVWRIGLYLSNIDSDVTKISKKDYKTSQGAMTACDTHLLTVYKKFNKWINLK